MLSIKGNSPCFLFQPDTAGIRGEAKLLPPNTSGRKYTLVLDLDETLVHYHGEPEGKSQFLIRPFAQQFLRKVSKKFELIIFTAALQDYADYILDRLDDKNSVSHRLYRQHTRFEGGVYQKDLSKLGRDLSRTLIIDNSAENFQLQPDNGIYIKSWYCDAEDEALKQLAPILVGKNFFDRKILLIKGMEMLGLL